MTTITITCQTTWQARADWVRENCRGFRDNTNWPMWSLGPDDISFEVQDKDAVWYQLVW